MGTQLVDTDFHGPLPPNTVGLIIGRASLILKGIRIHPGVTDPDFTGTIKVMVESPKGIATISPGDRTAQVLLLPSLHERFVAQNNVRGNGSFGSTGQTAAYLALDLQQWPMLNLAVEGRKVLGLLDTGADKSIIAVKDWPKGWPIQKSAQTLQGLGYAKAPNISARQLSWKDDEGHSGSLLPFVLELPMTLWGHDVLSGMGLHLTNNYSEAAQQMMDSMGYIPGRGLGKTLQGRVEPIQTKDNPDRQGLGFS